MMNMLIVVVEMRKRKNNNKHEEQEERCLKKGVSRNKNDYDLAESKASSSISTTWAKVGLRAGSCAQQAHMTAA